MPKNSSGKVPLTSGALHRGERCPIASSLTIINKYWNFKCSTCVHNFGMKEKGAIEIEEGRTCRNATGNTCVYCSSYTPAAEVITSLKAFFKISKSKKLNMMMTNIWNI